MEISFDDYAQEEDYAGREYFNNLINDYEKINKKHLKISLKMLFLKK